ncbi:MAG: Phasin (PHA-granule associated protein) [Burkholderiales bacterium RIFCSPHIGHO2_12_FULL_61_11]|nr:MAG: Phasin (PHA-granule associated protein) [Burkholderiales bacterium RIFCSPHIGHO2_12_FULL_61_11]
MNNAVEQFLATSKANLQGLERLTTQAFAGVEKLVELNITASKALLGESFGHMQAALGAKDAQELLTLQSDLLKPLTENSLAYVAYVKNIIAESGAEFTKAMEVKAVEAQRTFNGVLENLAKNAPAGSESAVAAFKSALTAGQNAVESAQISTKKAVELAHSNFVAAATQSAHAVKRATKAA